MYHQLLLKYPYRTSVIMPGLFWLAVVSSAMAQPTLRIAANTRAVGSGAVQLVYGGGSLTNNGSMSIATGRLVLAGSTTYAGSGTASVANATFSHNTGTTTLNSLLSVTGRATLAASTSLNANNQLHLRSDLQPNADMVNNGVLTGAVQGLVTKATVTTGSTPYSSTLSVNMSGTSVLYQWQSSADNSQWADVMGATSATYNASVSSSQYYRCRLTTSNSAYDQTTPAQLLNYTGVATCDAATWTARSAAEPNFWSSTTYGTVAGNGLFVAVAYSGTNRVMTSPDGITWTARAAAEANQWFSVTYGNGLFVAVSNTGNNRVMTSPDGITWTARAAAEANNWVSVTYGTVAGNGLFVAVASGGTNRVMTSPDGITWTARTAAEANNWVSVTYGTVAGNGLFVALASGGTNRVMTSPDGINWTARTAAQANQWTSMTYGTVAGNGLFVAVAVSGTNRAMTSPDGINWTARTAAQANSWLSVTYGNGLFVAVALSGTNQVMTSTDGITWTARAAAEANIWTYVTYGIVAGNGLFVAVAQSGTNRVMTACDVAPPCALSVNIAATPSLTIGTGQSTTLTASAGGATGAVSYTWSANAGGVVSNSVVATTAGTYSVTATSGACSATASAVVSVTFPAATRLYVNAGATSTGDGLSWPTAFTSLQSALTYPNSQSLTEVWVAAGVYKPTTTTGPVSRTISFAMRNGVAIYGGFAGTELNVSERPRISPTTGRPSSTTLSGDIGIANDISDNTYHIISNKNLDNTARLDGFFITAANANGSFGDASMGGMDNDESSPTITNCTFQSNTATNFAAAMMNRNGGSRPMISNCVFENNKAGSDGGAIYCDAGGNGGTLSNCSFYANSAGGSGGAIMNLGSLTLINTSFQDNSATSNGGALGNRSGPTPLINCSFKGNRATQNGGAIWVFQSEVRLTNCVLWDNGGSNMIVNGFSGTSTITYSLLESGTTVDITGPGTFTTNTSPFASATSVALRVDSPAIDAGDPATSAATVGATDLADNPRISGGRIDMGAVEFQSQAPPCALSVSIAATPSLTIGTGQSTTLTASASGATGVVSYTWSANAGGVRSASAVANATGTYSVTATSGACSATASAVVSVTFLTFCNTVVHVTPAGAGQKDGTSWANALAGIDLPPALATSCSGTTFLVGGGLYKPTTSTTNRAATFAIAPGVEVYGGYTVSGGTATRGPVNPVAGTPSSTTFSGDIDNNNVVNNANVNNVVSFSNAAASTRLDGVIVTGGYANQFNGSGGGIRVVGTGSPTISNCLITANLANNQGGGYFHDAPTSPILTSCVFTSNTAFVGGGIFTNTAVTLTLNGLQIRQNTAGQDGAGAYSNGPVVATGSDISQNAANSQGGAIFSNASNALLTLTNVQMRGNRANGPGGGILTKGPVLITGSDLSQNISNALGGAVHFDSGSSLSVTSSTLSQNQSSGPGGAISNNGSMTTTLTNVLMDDNVSVNSSGGSIYVGNSNSPLTMTNVRMRRNRASGPGGAIHAHGSVTITGCDISQNTCTSNGGAIVIQSGTSLSVTSSTLSQNQSSSPGGAISAFNSLTATLTDVSMDDNVCRFGPGGSLYLSGSNSPLTMTNVQMRRNVGANGGGTVYANGDVRLTNCDLSQNTGNGVGGALYISSFGSSLTAVNTRINQNRSDGSGGAVYMNGPVFLSGVQISQNTATGSSSDGGALYTGSASSFSVVSSTISQNQSTGQAGALYVSGNGSATAILSDVQMSQNTTANGQGGAFFQGNSNMTLLMNNVQMNENQSGSSGGGLAVFGPVSMTNCTLNQNRTVGGSGGGAVFANSSLSALNSRFNQNQTTMRGGAIFGNGPVSLTGCAISQNAATGGSNNSGGGLWLNSSQTNSLLSCSLVQNNSGQEGGAVYASGPVRIVNSLLSRNTATQTGGAVWTFSSLTLVNTSLSGNNAPEGAAVTTSGAVLAQNSILWNNGTPATSLTATGTGGSITLTHSLISPGATFTNGGNNKTADPLFTNVATDDLSLRECSPAIDAGNNAAYTAAGGGATDLAGNNRTVRATIDMGAYESQGALGVLSLTIAAAPSLTIGIGQSATLTASGADSFTWSANAGGVQSASVVVNGAGTYSVTGVTGSCSGTASAVVVISTPPSVTAQPPATLTACPDNNITLVVGTTRATAFQWLKGGIMISGQTSATLILPNLTPADAGVYSLSISGPGGSTTANSTTLTVNPAVTAVVSPQSVTICAGTTTTLTASGGTTYFWTGGASTSAISVSVAGTYSVTATTLGCSSVASATVTVNPAVTVPTLPSSITICGGTSTLLQATVPFTDSDIALVWNTGQTGNSISVGPLTTTTLFSVTATNTRTGCTAQASTIVVVTPATAFLTQPPARSVVCAGAPVSAPVSATGTGTIGYQWFFNGKPFANITPTLTIATVGIDDVGSYWVVATSACGSATSAAFALSLPVRYVTTTGAGLQDGSSWTNAYAGTQLQTAINQAGASVAGCGPIEVWVGAGTYKPTTTTGVAARAVSFSLVNNVRVRGGFAGSELSIYQRPLASLSAPGSTTLSGDLGIAGNPDDNSYHVTYNPPGLSGSGASLWEGLVITGGSATGNPGTGNENGGGMYTQATGSGASVSRPTLRNCHITGNLASFGGGMYNDGRSGGGANPTIENCYFIANRSINNGAAMLNDGSQGQSNPRIVNSEFRQNLSENGYGAAVYNLGAQGESSPVFVNSVFWSNQGGVTDGAVGNNANGGGSSRSVFMNCTFARNRRDAQKSAGPGAPVSSTFFGIQVINSIFWDNGTNDVLGLTGGNPALVRNSAFDTGVNSYSNGGNNVVLGATPFTDVVGGDLRLSGCASGSVIDQGDAVAYQSVNGPAADVIGMARVQGLSLDLGAYERPNGLGSGTIQTVQNGLWSDPATWSCGRVPTLSDVVLLNHAVTVPSGYLAQGLTVRYGAGARLLWQTGGRLQLGR